MPYRRTTLSLMAVASLLSFSTVLAQTRAEPGTWNSDFTSRSPATEQCPGGTLPQLREVMLVDGPLSERDLNASTSLQVRPTDGEELYAFQYHSDPSAENYWGFSGYLVASGDCIVYAAVLGYDN